MKFVVNLTFIQLRAPAYQFLYKKSFFFLISQTMNALLFLNDLPQLRRNEKEFEPEISIGVIVDEGAARSQLYA